MDLKDILAISGKPGLFQLVSNARNGLIVESFEDKKRIPAYASEKISALEDIAIFTAEGEKPLVDVFRKIHEKENGGVSINHKSPSKQLRAYFSEVVPDHDRDKVYTSDIKRVISWYNILHKHNLVVFEEEKEQSENTEENAEMKEESETTEN